jgi:hypothetical protein
MEDAVAEVTVLPRRPVSSKSSAESSDQIYFSLTFSTYKRNTIPKKKLRLPNKQNPNDI